MGLGEVQNGLMITMLHGLLCVKLDMVATYAMLVSIIMELCTQEATSTNA